MPHFDHLKRRHARLEREIAAEITRPNPCSLRMAQLKKAKLAVRDRMAALAARRRSELLPQPA